MAKECKNCAHESNFKKHECGTCMVSYYDGEPLGLPSNFKPKTMTNADRIRAMSDEELAKWLLDVMKHKVACFGEGAFKYTPCRNVEHDCVKCGVSWLKQPAETPTADNSSAITADRCVCCGAIIPEDSWVCPNCLVAVNERR